METNLQNLLLPLNVPMHVYLNLIENRVILLVSANCPSCKKQRERKNLNDAQIDLHTCDMEWSVHLKEYLIDAILQVAQILNFPQFDKESARVHAEYIWNLLLQREQKRDSQNMERICMLNVATETLQILRDTAGWGEFVTLVGLKAKEIMQTTCKACGNTSIMEANFPENHRPGCLSTAKYCIMKEFETAVRDAAIELKIDWFSGQHLLERNKLLMEIILTNANLIDQIILESLPENVFNYDSNELPEEALEQSIFLFQF